MCVGGIEARGWKEYTNRAEASQKRDERIVIKLFDLDRWKLARKKML